MFTLMRRAMLWVVLTALIFPALSLLPPFRDGAIAERRVTLYFFWATGCPHCMKEKAFLEKLNRKYPGLDIRSLEVMHHRENAVLFSRLSEAYGITVKGVPVTFIGNLEPVVGYHSDETTGKEVEEKVRYSMMHGFADPLSRLDVRGQQPSLLSDMYKGETEGLCGREAECPEGTAESGGLTTSGSSSAGKAATGAIQERRDAEKRIVTIPLVGSVDLSETALPLQTLIIAGLDGFNPCAFFVLFTLLGLLIHVQSKKKLLLVGGIFVFFSGLIYFLFMAAWLNIFLLTGQIAAVTLAAGAVALVIAGINIKDFFYFGKGVSLTIPERAKPGLYSRMRGLIRATSLLPVITGTVVLAAAANTYELFCTAGFPMLYTKILTLRALPKFSYYLYLLFYNVVYVVPLATIVIIFAVTLGTRKMTESHGRALKLLSGMMMLGLGAVMLINPELLNNVVITAGLLVAALAASGLIMLVSRKVEREGKAAT